MVYGWLAPDLGLCLNLHHDQFAPDFGLSFDGVIGHSWCGTAPTG